jgi:hypothetical protein
MTLAEDDQLDYIQFEKLPGSVKILPPLVPSKGIFEVVEFLVLPRHNIYAEHIEPDLRSSLLGQLAHILAS